MFTALIAQRPAGQAEVAGNTNGAGLARPEAGRTLRAAWPQFEASWRSLTGQSEIVGSEGGCEPRVAPRACSIRTCAWTDAHPATTLGPMSASRPSAAVLVSGGVDSSLALALLAREGACDLTAFYLRIWLEDELAFLGACPWEEDLAFVRATTDRLGVPLEVISLQRAYHDRVVAHALDELRAGRTPSPDLLCNSRIKFGAFLEAIGDGFDLVATGHYARHIQPEGAPAQLHRAPDPVKDQTYFLARLSPAQLSRARFPIGHLTKPEVRRLAADLDLPSRARPDSQGICFLGRIPYPDFVHAHLGDAPGPIIDLTTGRTLGAHRGLWYATIGQRKGRGLGGGPWYVVDKDPDRRALLVVHADHLAAHARCDLEVEAIHWLSPESPELPPRGAFRWHARVRHGPALTACDVAPGARPDQLRVSLAEPDAGLAPGQYVVFYDGPRCLGSGVIR